VVDGPLKILVVGPAWIGDMVLAQSLFRLLTQRQPRPRLDVLAPAWTHPLLARMPEVDEALAAPFTHRKFDLGARLKLGRALRARGYDHALVLPNSWKSALVPWAARIPRRSGFVGELRYGLLNDARRLDKQKLPRTVDRFVALGLEPGEGLPEIPSPCLRADAENARAALARFGRRDRPTAPVLALCPGAEFGPAKRWPAEYFTEVALAKLVQGWDVWLFGSDKDAAVTAAVQAATGGRCLNLGGRTTLTEAIDLLALATAVVTNDSGLMHIAAALDRRVVALYGSSDPGHTPPLSARATLLSLSLPCSPCFQRECPLGHLKCLKDLHPAVVRDALDGSFPTPPASSVPGPQF
jgi:heptosyltransferase-2